MSMFSIVKYMFSLHVHVFYSKIHVFLTCTCFYGVIDGAYTYVHFVFSKTSRDYSYSKIHVFLSKIHVS